MIFPHPYVIGAAVLLIASAYGLGRLNGASAVREDFEHEKAQAVAKAAVEAAAAARKDVQVVTEYVDRVQTIEKHVPVVRDRIVRVCDQARRDAGLPSGASNPHARAAPNADDRSADRFAADVIACRENTEQLRALIAWKVENGG